ncbi:16906_t:CDS:2, partial [Funneliformis mosseae]
MNRDMNGVMKGIPMSENTKMIFFAQSKPTGRQRQLGEESIVDYCLKAKKCNNIVKLCKGHFRSEFYSGLTQENVRYIAKNDYYCELVEILIQAEKESVTSIITGFKDYISQS